MSARILVASLLILAASATGETDDSPSIFLKSVNLVQNAGFERSTGDTAAADWHAPGNGETHKAHSIDKNAHQGARCVTIQKGDRKRWASWWQDVEAAGDREYRIAGWIKVTGGSLASVAIYFFDSEGARIGVEGVGRKGATDWTEISKTIKAPPGTVRGRLHCGVLHQGQVWFDDILLEPVHNPALRPMAQYLYYPCLGGMESVKIDGKLGDWDGIPRLKLGTQKPLHQAEKIFEPSDAKWQGPKDLSAQVGLAWDAENLYLAVNATDNKFPVSGEYYWQGDSVQFAIDTGQEKASTPDDNDYEIGLGLSKNSVETVFDFKPEGSDFQPKHVKSAVRPTDKGYIVEAAVPWKRMGIKDISKHSGLGYSFLINDNDGDGRKWLEWASGIGMSKDPSLYATLALVQPGTQLHLRFRNGKTTFRTHSPAKLSVRMDALKELSDPVRLSLFLQGKGGKRMAHFTRKMALSPGTWRYDIALDTARVTPGNYTVRAVVKNPGDKTLAEDSVKLQIEK